MHNHQALQGMHTYLTGHGIHITNHHTLDALINLFTSTGIITPPTQEGAPQ